MRKCAEAIIIALIVGISVLRAGAIPRLHRICASPNGTNTIEWFENADTCEKLVSITIYGRENKFSPFKKIAEEFSAFSTEYIHTGASAFQKGTYYLMYVIRCGGNDVSINSDTLAVDTQAPDITDPDSVSIINGKAVMGWTASKAPDAESYVIYRTVGSSNFPIDTVYGKDNTFFIDTGFGDPTKGNERYKIAAVDSCDNIAPIGNYHETIFLKFSANRCQGQLYLNWSSYVGWGNGVDHYDVFVSDGGNFSKVGSTGQLQDTINGLKTGTTYKIFIRAYEKGGLASSSSNVIVVTPDFGDQLEYLYISNVTYQGSNIIVNWMAAANPKLKRFEVWRGLDKVHMIKAADLDSSKSTWVDHSPGKSVRYYKVLAFNTCGKLLAESNISNSILLSVTKENDHRILHWNAYASWLNGVSGYDVYKVIYGGDTSHLQPLGSTDKLTLFLEDTTSILWDTLPGACYYVQAHEAGFNKLGINGLSTSSIVCYLNAPIVFIPNAFVPHENVNTHFKPSLLNVDFANSSLVIYNRWGQITADKIDLQIGWDGLLSNGEVAPEGVYFYILQVQGIDGSRQLYKGTVTLL